VNIVIPEFITTVPDIAKRCELAIIKVKDNHKPTKKSSLRKDPSQPIYLKSQPVRGQKTRKKEGG